MDEAGDTLPVLDGELFRAHSRGDTMFEKLLKPSKCTGVRVVFAEGAKLLAALSKYAADAFASGETEANRVGPAVKAQED
jgi:hypothetical protein